MLTGSSTFAIILSLVVPRNIEASIGGGFSRGFHPVMLKDLIETTDDPRRRELQRLLMERSWPYLYGPVIESARASKALGIVSSADIGEGSPSTNGTRNHT